MRSSIASRSERGAGNFNNCSTSSTRSSQGVHREQGETIQDFISRRAQYYRGLLEQANELRQKGPLADLQAEKDRVTGVDRAQGS
jgi:hypothetical protein